MRMTISEFLEHVERALRRGRYRLNAVEDRSKSDPAVQGVQSPDYVVVVQDSQTGRRHDFRVSREELATDARGEWQASIIARTVQELTRQPDVACPKP